MKFKRWQKSWNPPKKVVLVALVVGVIGLMWLAAFNYAIMDWAIGSPSQPDSVLRHYTDHEEEIQEHLAYLNVTVFQSFQDFEWTTYYRYSYDIYDFYDMVVAKNVDVVMNQKEIRDFEAWNEMELDTYYQYKTYYFWFMERIPGVGYGMHVYKGYDWTYLTINGECIE